MAYELYDTTNGVPEYFKDRKGKLNWNKNKHIYFKKILISKN